MFWTRKSLSFCSAVSSFFSFSVDAIIPVLPFLWLAPRVAAFVSGGAALLMLGTVGGLLGFLTGSGTVRSSLRMVGLASLATGITVLIGRLVGVSTG